MSERVRSDFILERFAGKHRGHYANCGCGECTALHDLLDARKKAEAQATEHRREYCEIMSENIGYRQRIAELEKERDEARLVLEAARELRREALKIPKHMTGGEWPDVVLPMMLAGNIVEAIRIYDLTRAAGGGDE
jgi:hypothetical protein